MTLDEAIKHCEEKEKEQALNGRFACAEEHKQLAEWLKELKRYREADYLRQRYEKYNDSVTKLIDDVSTIPIQREVKNCFGCNGDKDFGCEDCLNKSKNEKLKEEWIRCENGYIMCPFCKIDSKHGAWWKYCPKCGADLRGE